MLFRRIEDPPARTKYQDYKEHLRRDFQRRCAYCLILEAHYGGLRNYHVDHFRPKKRFPHLILTYTNLYYACGLCNTFKGETWPSLEQQGSGFGFSDPCEEDPYQKHFEVDKRDGSLHALTNVGLYMSQHLRLNRRQLRKYRRMQAELKEKCNEIRSLLSASGLPTELITRVEGTLSDIERSYFNSPPPYEVADLLP